MLLTQMGCFMEMYDDDVLTSGKALGLKLQESSRRMKTAAGFPLRHERRNIARLLRMGRDVAVIREGGSGKFVKERYVDELYRIKESTSQRGWKKCESTF